METWHDLAFVYIRMSQWRDAEICLSKSNAINAHSASRWHTTGMPNLYSVICEIALAVLICGCYGV